MTTIEAPVGRPPLLAQAAASVAVSAALMGLAHWDLLALELGTFAVQVVLVLGFLALVDAPAAVGIFVLGTAAAAATEVTTHVADGRVGGLAGVVAVAFVGGQLQQLARKQRSRVTESLADTLVVVVLVASVACLPAALQHAQGEVALRCGLLATGTALVVGRVVDRLADRAVIAPEATRTWPGLGLGLVAGAAVAVPEAGNALTTREALLIGLAAAATAAIADLFVDLAASEVMTRRLDDRRVVSLRPVTLMLPWAAVAPVLFVAVRLLERS